MRVARSGSSVGVGDRAGALDGLVFDEIALDGGGVTSTVCGVEVTTGGGGVDPHATSVTVRSPTTTPRSPNRSELGAALTSVPPTDRVAGVTSMSHWARAGGLGIVGAAGSEPRPDLRL